MIGSADMLSPMPTADETTDAPEILGRRERRKVETRQRLLESARALIAEGGPEAIRITEVAERADVGFGTFYTYFDSKQALIEAVIGDVMARTAELIGTRALESADPAEAAAIAYRRFFAYSTEEPEFAAVLLSLPDAESTFEAALRPQALQTLRRGIEQGRFDIDDLELALTSVMLLRAFGVPDRDAREIAGRPLPEIPLGT
jgi:AcrR family transcriptional regulator